MEEEAEMAAKVEAEVEMAAAPRKAEAGETGKADCLGCRLTGTAALGFVSAYMFYERAQLPRSHHARPYMAVVGAGNALGKPSGARKGAARPR